MIMYGKYVTFKTNTVRIFIFVQIIIFSCIFLDNGKDDDTIHNVNSYGTGHSYFKARGYAAYANLLSRFFLFLAC